MTFKLSHFKNRCVLLICLMPLSVVHGSQDAFNRSHIELPYHLEDAYTAQVKDNFNQSLQRMEQMQLNSQTMKYIQSEEIVLQLDGKVSNLKKRLKKLPKGLGTSIPLLGQFNFLHLSGDSSPEVVDYLIEQGADVNLPDMRGKTPIFYVRDVKVFKRLLHHGADLNVVDLQGQSPLFFLQTPLLNELLKARGSAKYSVDPNAINKLGKTPLFYADADEAKVLYALGASLDIQDNQGRTALFGAKDPAFIRFLVSHGMKINTKDEDGRTALSFANNEGALNTLIELGANAELTDKEGMPIVLGLLRNEITREFRHDNAKILALIKQVRAAGLSANFADKDGNTLLHVYNCQLFNADVLSELLKLDIDINSKNKAGNTPIMAVLDDVENDRSKSEDCILAMMTPSVDLMVTTSPQHPYLTNTPIVARLGVYPRALVAAARLGADLNWTNERHENVAFKLISSYSYVERRLTQKEEFDIYRNNAKRPDTYSGIEPDILKSYEQALRLPQLNLKLLDKFGVPAWAEMLSFCSTKKDLSDAWLDRLKLILTLPIDINFVDKDGKSALHYAAKENCRRVYDVLIEHGINKDIRDKNGKLASYYFP